MRAAPGKDRYAVRDRLRSTAAAGQLPANALILAAECDTVGFAGCRVEAHEYHQYREFVLR